MYKLINPNPHTVKINDEKGNAIFVEPDSMRQHMKQTHAIVEIADAPHYAEFVELGMLSRVEATEPIQVPTEPQIEADPSAVKEVLQSDDDKEQVEDTTPLVEKVETPEPVVEEPVKRVAKKAVKKTAKAKPKRRVKKD